MKRLKVCQTGCVLLCIFCFALVCQIIYFVAGLLGKIGSHTGWSGNASFWLAYIVLAVIVDSIIFWIGIVLVYLTSVQLGIKWRVLGIACGWVPVVNLLMLQRIIKLCNQEIRVEKNKIKLNDKRADDRICETKYPLLLVHGVFFRDFKHVNYWGRIPGELERNGATIFYGNHNSAAAVDDSAQEIARRIDEILLETGAPKVNIIAHSKGGLDSRTAIAKCDMGGKVASLTTINTPHRGCEFADYLLEKIPESIRDKIAHTYNHAAAIAGDTDPDFLSAVYDLTHNNCSQRNEEILDDERVYYQSVGSTQKKMTSGRFPLNMTYKFVKYFDGPNDGLVGEKSFPWGDNFTMLSSKGNRGISHADMIDLNRENFDDFDVREFYVQLVYDLKKKGY